MSRCPFLGVVKHLPFRDNTLCVPENVAATLQYFVDGRRTGSVILTMRGGEFDRVSIAETASVK